MSQASGERAVCPCVRAERPIEPCGPECFHFHGGMKGLPCKHCGQPGVADHDRRPRETPKAGERRVVHRQGSDGETWDVEYLEANGMWMLVYECPNELDALLLCHGAAAVEALKRIVKADDDYWENWSSDEGCQAIEAARVALARLRAEG